MLIRCFLLYVCLLLTACGGDDKGESKLNNEPGGGSEGQAPTLTVSSLSVTEGDSGNIVASLVLQLSRSTTAAVELHYVTVDDTAVVGSDYLSAEGNIRFAAGSVEETLEITVYGDEISEDDERFIVRFSNVQNAVLDSNEVVVTILNDDPASPPNLPQLSISDAETIEGDSGNGTMVFDVELSMASSSPVSVAYVTENIGQADETDYAEVSDGVLNISAGATTAAVQITVYGDTLVETDESFRVRLLNPVNAALSNNSATGVIRNDDSASPQPSISINDISITEGDSGTSNAQFTVSLSAASGQAVTVDYVTSDNTAISGSDYTQTNDTLTIDAGETSAMISVSVNGDENVEDDETFTVQLSNPVNATISDGTGVATIEDDDTPPPVVGYDERPENTSCSASGVTAPSSASVSNHFPNINFNASYLSRLISGLRHYDGRWFYTMTDGEFGWFDANDTNTATLNVIQTFDVDNRGEGGLLGFAFDPEFENNGYIYVSFTEFLNAGGDETYNPFASVIARYTLDTSSYVLQPGSRLDLINFAQAYGNHNGGDIHFGPDGYLYIGFGDGGNERDDPGWAQDPNTFFGSMLRIDVRNNNTADGLPYDIPADNPFVSGGGAPEVWAYGFRNPWKWSFDTVSGRLWLGDVGEGDYEEVDIVEAGQNYGWPCREGAHDFVNSNQAYCQGKTFTDPVHDYARPFGAIAGGYVYRGSDLPGLNGAYVFTDIYQHNLVALIPQGADNYVAQTLIAAGNGVAATVFGQDDEGEIYLGMFALGWTEGRLYRVEPSGGGGGGGGGPETLLSQTGCVNPANPSEPTSGVIPFSINEPFWSDNAVKERFIALPDGQDISIDADGDLVFPVDTVLMKHFRLNGRLIETRLLMHQAQDVWEGFSYEWNVDETDAVLLDTGKTVEIDGQDWIYPSRTDCLACHTEIAGHALGPELKQLNKDHYYSVTDRTANQLDTWEHIDFFNRALSIAEKQNSLTPSRNNPTADLNERARSYLHSNCAQCHRGPGSPSGLAIDFRSRLSLDQMNICNVDPVRGAVGISDDPKILAPTEPERSVLYVRLNSDNISGNRMPPFGSNVMDTDGIDLIDQWISTNITSCTP